jgi:predicted O-linked N-acetylglucosamine transferase (SPINDLY family)
LAADEPRLARWRGELRERVRLSPLCDATRFARAFEAALREMWHGWCRS